MAGELAKRMDDLSGPEKAAVIMLALGNDHGAQLWPLMDDEEIRDISMAMASLGKIDPEVIELLVNGDADIFAESNDGSTPFFWIRTRRTREKFEELIAARDRRLAAATPTDTVVLPPPEDATDTEDDTDNINVWKEDTAASRTVTFDDGSVYEGEWKVARMHGEGTLTFADGETYSGSWRKNERCGFGIHRLPEGETYEGEWKHGQRHGKGRYSFGSKIDINGTWKKDSLDEGTGTFTFDNADRYIGEWRDDKMHGRGVFTTADGQVYDGYWKANRFVKPAKQDDED